MVVLPSGLNGYAEPEEALGHKALAFSGGSSTSS